MEGVHSNGAYLQPPGVPRQPVRLVSVALRPRAAVGCRVPVVVQQPQVVVVAAVRRRQQVVVPACPPEAVVAHQVVQARCRQESARVVVEQVQRECWQVPVAVVQVGAVVGVVGAAVGVVDAQQEVDEQPPVDDQPVVGVQVPRWVVEVAQRHGH